MQSSDRYNILLPLRKMQESEIKSHDDIETSLTIVEGKTTWVLHWKNKNINKFTDYLIKEINKTFNLYKLGILFELSYILLVNWLKVSVQVTYCPLGIKEFGLVVITLCLFFHFFSFFFFFFFLKICFYFHVVLGTPPTLLKLRPCLEIANQKSVCKINKSY